MSQRRSLIFSLAFLTATSANFLACSSDTENAGTDDSTGADANVDDASDNGDRSRANDGGASPDAPDAAKDDASQDAARQTFAIGGSIAGLEGKGLVLVNGSEELTIANDAKTFAFATELEKGKSYSVSVKTQPADPTQVCSVAGSEGTVVAGDVSSISVVCEDRYSLGGSVSGLEGKDLRLKSGTDEVTVNANGAFAFPSPLKPGDSYSIEVEANPTEPWQTCTVANASGGAVDADVTLPSVTCTTNTYVVRGTIDNLVAGGLALALYPGGPSIAIESGATSFAFDPAASLTAYDVQVTSSPMGPSQTCTVTNGTGTLTNLDVGGVSVSCKTSYFNVGGKVNSIAGTGLVLQLNGKDDITLDAIGDFTFPNPVVSGADYSVTVKTPSNAAGTVCIVANGSGTIGGSEIANIVVDCGAPKKVFTSSQRFSATFGGLSGADAACQSLATTAGLSGTFKAWLSDSTGSPNKRFTKSSLPYARVDGTVIAQNWTQLTSGHLAAAPSLDESGNRAPGNPYSSYLFVWTNTTAGGDMSSTSYSCGDWNSTAGASSYGMFDYTNGYWTDGAVGGSCTRQYPIYCFEQ